MLSKMAQLASRTTGNCLRYRHKNSTKIGRRSDANRDDLVVSGVSEISSDVRMTHLISGRCGYQ
jgi:hypothetical protein